uniref:Uncharacterized protein n=1 Tax=Anguilla anguilla TaxID=7936 RepID=A0A0E9UEG9_ANGAN
MHMRKAVLLPTIYTLQ